MSISDASPEHQDESADSEWGRQWRVVCAACCGIALANAPIYATQIMIRPLEKAFGWSRAAITSGPLMISIVAVFGGPLIGLAVDRFGPRRIAMAGAVLVCLSLGSLANANASLWSWWMLWAAQAFSALLVLLAAIWGVITIPFILL